MSDYYDYPEGYGAGNSWREIQKHRHLIEADFQEFYNIDLCSGIKRERTWRWYAARVLGLLNKPPVITKLGDGKLHQLPVTRLGMKLNPPKT